jgi:hypothetical protein
MGIVFVKVRPSWGFSLGGFLRLSWVNKKFY